MVSGRSENPAITQLELARSSFYILMSEQFHLSSELAGLRWILFDRLVDASLYDTVMRVAESEGGVPVAVHHVATAEEAAQVLYNESSDIAFLTRADAWRVARNGLSMRPFGEERLPLISTLIARRDNSSKIVSEFTRVLKRKLDAPRGVQLNLRGVQLNLPWQKKPVLKHHHSSSTRVLGTI